MYTGERGEHFSAVLILNISILSFFSHDTDYLYIPRVGEMGKMMLGVTGKSGWFKQILQV